MPASKVHFGAPCRRKADHVTQIFTILSRPSRVCPAFPRARPRLNGHGLNGHREHRRTRASRRRGSLRLARGKDPPGPRTAVARVDARTRGGAGPHPGRAEGDHGQGLPRQLEDPRRLLPGELPELRRPRATAVDRGEHARFGHPGRPHPRHPAGSPVVLGAGPLPVPDGHGRPLRRHAVDAQRMEPGPPAHPGRLRAAHRRRTGRALG